MNPFDQITQAIQARFPAARITVDPAGVPGGSWYLDVVHGDGSVVVEWRPDRGFGISANRDVAFGEGADEHYPEPQAAARRVLQLLESGSATLPSLADRLRRIRAVRQITQAELAKQLGIQQASISKLESRGESASVRKLQELFAAMGGRLSLHVTFENGHVEELQLEDIRKNLPAGTCR